MAVQRFCTAVIFALLFHSTVKAKAGSCSTGHSLLQTEQHIARATHGQRVTHSRQKHLHEKILGHTTKHQKDLRKASRAKTSRSKRHARMTSKSTSKQSKHRNVRKWSEKDWTPEKWDQGAFGSSFDGKVENKKKKDDLDENKKKTKEEQKEKTEPDEVRGKEEETAKKLEKQSANEGDQKEDETDSERKAVVGGEEQKQEEKEYKKGNAKSTRLSGSFHLLSAIAVLFFKVS
eukprot:gnl/MRDRNA2_/MRDRNA2_91196_c0_seq1.p1 gnl/MRDRNA2_/MRDRNA2_91196_c0~~gnl/MRDRNA2_/MRDRNA2_91196_c0_seq1.p1  ORF type:complete len:257 (-),score=65.93 gnl/MRDRNA2_/MRDRNA2_91196_c0_seq1:53-751(-)